MNYFLETTKKFFLLLHLIFEIFKKYSWKRFWKNIVKITKYNQMNTKDLIIFLVFWKRNNYSLKKNISIINKTIINKIQDKFKLLIFGLILLNK